MLYSAGYVHRDISVGNVLLCGDRAKLTDLEYARQFEAVSTEAGQEEVVTHIRDGPDARVKTVSFRSFFSYWTASLIVC